MHHLAAAVPKRLKLHVNAQNVCLCFVAVVALVTFSVLTLQSTPPPDLLIGDIVGASGGRVLVVQQVHADSTVTLESLDEMQARYIQGSMYISANKRQGIQESVDKLRLLQKSSIHNPYRAAGIAPNCRDAKKLLNILPADMQKAVQGPRMESDSGIEHKKLFTAFQCPAFDSDEIAESHVKQLKTYASRKDQCESARGMWHRNDIAPVVRCKYETMVNLLDLGPGNVVVDWGAGCGHALDWIAGRRPFHAIGLDIVKENVAWAKQNMPHLDEFCATESADFKFIPNNSVDFFFSNAVLYHVPAKEQCALVRDEIFRILRVGRCSWHGWLGVARTREKGWHPGDQVKPEFWTKDCLANLPGVVAATFEEKAAFGVSEYDAEPFSLLFCKLSASLQEPPAES